MNLDTILAELREEASRINEAILVIERLMQANGKRRGRPPKWMSGPAVLTKQIERPKTGSEE